MVIAAAAVRALAVVSIGASALAFGAAAPSSTPAASVLPTDASGLLDYGACLAAEGEGDLLLLIDESASLRQNDPQDARVTAAIYLARRLAEVTTSAEIDLDVSVAGFASEYDMALDWTQLDAAGLPAVEAAVGTFAARDAGMDTDYWNALEGTRRALADHATAAGGARRCQAVAWFSDGQFDIEARDTAARREKYGTAKVYAPGVDLRTLDGAVAAEEAGRASICRPAGLADQLRASGVWTLGVGLVAGESSGQDFSFMRSIATGADDAGATCGQIQNPPPGEFALASDIDELLFAFDRFANPGRAPLEQTAGVCQASVCSEQAHRFVLDASISGVHILGTSDVDGVRAVLVAPTGEQVPLDRVTTGQATDTRVNDVLISYTWQSEHTVTIDLSREDPGAGWPGPWSVIFVDDTASSPEGQSRSNIHITGNLVPTLTAPSGTVRAGESATGFRLGLADTSGEEVDPATLLGQAVASVELVSPGGDTTPIADAVSGEGWAQELALDLTSAAPGEYTVRVQLRITTAAATLADGTTLPGTALSPQRVDVPLTVLPPADFPAVGGRIDFGIAEGPARLTAQLPVTGPGCVWIQEGTEDLLAFPTEAGRITVTADASSSGSCVEVGEGDEATIALELTTQEAGNGSVNGTLTVTLAPLDDLSRTTTVALPFSADLRHPINQSTWVLGLVLALLLGPGIPIAILYLIKIVGARIPPRALFAQAIPVTVREGTVLRDGAPFALRDSDLVELVRLSARGARSAAAAGVTLRTHVGLSPFAPPAVVVEAPGRIGSSSTHARPHGRTRQARLPLAVHNTWAVLVDPGDPPDAAVVVLLVGADASTERRRDLVDDLTRKVPDRFRDLRRMLDDAPPPADGRGGRHAGPVAPAAAPVDDPFGVAEAAGLPSASPWSGDPYDFSVERDGDQP